MSTRSGLFALTGVGLMVLMAVGPGAAVAASTAENTGNTEAGNTFGMSVSSFVHQLTAGNGYAGNQPMGQLVSEFVTSNNPGADKKPGHAGPPGNSGNTATASGNGNGGGPPEHAGSGGGNGTPGGGGNAGGPPDHAKGNKGK